MGARTASGDETRVALGIRVGLNYSAPGSQNIFIFIVSPAHLLARSSLSLPEHILFLRPHKYLNQLMTPLEELKGSISQHLKVGSGTQRRLCPCWFGNQSPGLRDIAANPQMMGGKTKTTQLGNIFWSFFYWVTTFLLFTVCSGLSAGCCGQHGLRCCDPRSSKMPSWHRSLRLSSISFHSFLFVIIFALPTK